MRLTGTTSRGIRGPIVREGDDIVSFVLTSVMAAVREENIELNDRDVICVTEALVARAQGNYASVDQIAKDIQTKYPEGTIGVVFPILSRNRFAINLKGIARGAKKVILQLSFPADEVGNHLLTPDELEEHDVNPWRDVFGEEKYRDLFGENLHPFTGVDYVAYYRSIVEEEGCEVDFVFANDAREILNHTKHVLTCDIHSRARNKRRLIEAGVETLYNLEDILSHSVDGSGYNADYGLLGSNKANEERVKLFPRACSPVVEAIAEGMKQRTGKQIEVMIYGDGAFRDPIGQIWELADPVVSPAYTPGLEGVPNELKLKYLADGEFIDLKGEELDRAIREKIHQKDSDLKGNMATEGTTPRRITDLLGSLADLTSGSGDKGTPIVLIQGYFDNITD